MEDSKLPKNPFLKSEEERKQELQKLGFSSFNEESIYSIVIRVLYFHPKITEEDFSKISRIRTKSQYDELIKKYNIEYLLKVYSNMNEEARRMFIINVNSKALKILQKKQASAENAMKYFEKRFEIRKKSTETSKKKYNIENNNQYNNPFKNTNPFKIDEQELALEAKEKGFNSIEEQECYEDIILCCIKLNPSIDLKIINWDMFKTKEQQYVLIKQYGYEEILNKYLKLDSDARTIFKINMITKYSASSEYDYKPKTHK